VLLREPLGQLPEVRGSLLQPSGRRAELGERGDGDLGVLRGLPVYDHAGAPEGEPQCGLQPESVGGTGDERGAAGEGEGVSGHVDSFGKSRRVERAHGASAVVDRSARGRFTQRQRAR
jgi:hypothetical protein